MLIALYEGQQLYLLTSSNNAGIWLVAHKVSLLTAEMFSFGTYQSIQNDNHRRACVALEPAAGR